MITDDITTELSTNGTAVCDYISGQLDSIQLFDCPPRMHGRYVTVGRIDTGFLNVYEVEVIGW